MEIEYDEKKEIYYITEDGDTLIDTLEERMEWTKLNEAEKYRTNLEMVRLIYGNQ